MTKQEKNVHFFIFTEFRKLNPQPLCIKHYVFRTNCLRHCFLQVHYIRYQDKEI